MYCMKCGRETKENRIFCEICQADMAAYPVKPGTPVHLPVRPASTAPRKAPSRRKSQTAAEQLGKLRRTIQWLALGMIVLVAALFITISMLVHTLEAQNTQDTIGRNYNTMVQTDGK